jgi:hypothetical protein
VILTVTPGHRFHRKTVHFLFLPLSNRSSPRYFPITAVPRFTSPPNTGVPPPQPRRWSHPAGGWPAEVAAWGRAAGHHDGAASPGAVRVDASQENRAALPAQRSPRAPAPRSAARGRAGGGGVGGLVLQPRLGGSTKSSQLGHHAGTRGVAHVPDGSQPLTARRDLAPCCCRLVWRRLKTTWQIGPACKWREFKWAELGLELHNGLRGGGKWAFRICGVELSQTWFSKLTKWSGVYTVKFMEQSWFFFQTSRLTIYSI